MFSINVRLKPRLSKYYRFMGVSMFLSGLKMLMISKIGEKSPFLKDKFEKLMKF